MYKPSAGVDNLPDMVDNLPELVVNVLFGEKLPARPRDRPVITAPDAAQPAGPSRPGLRGPPPPVTTTIL